MSNERKALLEISEDDAALVASFLNWSNQPVAANGDRYGLQDAGLRALLGRMRAALDAAKETT